MNILKITAMFIVAIALSVASWFYWQHSKLYPSTDDAYLKAHVIQVSPQVSGRIVELDVTAHQKVKKGQKLLVIDPLPYQYGLNQAQAAYDLATKQVSVQASSVLSARSAVMQAEANLTDARSHANRVKSLAKKGLVNKDESEHADSVFRQAKAALNSSKAELQKAIKALGSENADNADVRKAAAALAKAEYDLKNTVLIARHDGLLGDVNIRVGNVVRSNQSLFPMVETDEYWIEANFKETDLQRLKTGQLVNIELDMYPDTVIQGMVQSVSPASGASFSLLPPENATGNWVKVTQRFPVRITVKMTADLPDLRIGASAMVTVDTEAVIQHQ